MCWKGNDCRLSNEPMDMLWDKMIETFYCMIVTKSQIARPINVTCSYPLATSKDDV